MRLLGNFEFVDTHDATSFVRSCEDHRHGGFCKMADHYPDLLHSYYSICWLSMTEHPGFKPLDCALGMSARARAHVDALAGHCAD